MRKIISMHYLHFSFEKNISSQILKDFSVENSETTPSTLLLKLSSAIYLPRIINYWGSIFTLYLTSWVFSLVCILSVFFSFFLSSFFSFLYWYFPWQTLTIHRIPGKGEGIFIFLVFRFHPNIILLLHSERLNQMRLTLLATIVYLSHLPNPSPSHHLSFICLPKCVRNEGCFTFLQEIGRGIKKSIFTLLK